MRVTKSSTFHFFSYRQLHVEKMKHATFRNARGYVLTDGMMRDERQATRTVLI